MAMGPGIVDRVVVVRGVVGGVVGGAGLPGVDTAAAVVVTALLDVDASDDVVVPPSRASRVGRSPLPHALATSINATPATTGRTHVVSRPNECLPARDGRAPGGSDLRPTAGYRPGRRGRDVRRLLPFRPSHALRRRRSRARAHRVMGDAGRDRSRD